MLGSGTRIADGQAAPQVRALSLVERSMTHCVDVDRQDVCIGEYQCVVACDGYAVRCERIDRGTQSL